MEALKAGNESGGDKRGVKSAAITVMDKAKILVSLRIDENPSPIKELVRYTLEQLDMAAETLKEGGESLA